MEKFAITHALIHTMGKDGVSVGHSYHLGHGPFGRFVTALEYELLPCGGVRIGQYSQPDNSTYTKPHEVMSGADELKHFVYPACIYTGKAEFTLEN